MRSAFATAACIGLFLSTGAVPLLAQMQNNTEKQMNCDNHNYDGDRARHCEIREQTLASIGRLGVEGHNGGMTVKGWLRNDVLVRARVETTAETQGAADLLATRVWVDSSGGQVRSVGPDSVNNDHTGWSVSYEVFVPQATDLNVKTHNGGVTVSDVRGQIRVDGYNGGVNLKRVAGDVGGTTHNGGIQVELVGTVADARQLELSTYNGGISVALPANYSAHLQAETSNGHIQSDFPVTVTGEVRPRKLDSNIGGGGGPLIHLTTHNGQVAIKRAGAM